MSDTTVGEAARPSRRLSKRASVSLLAVTASLLAMLVITNGAGAFTRAGSASSAQAPSALAGGLSSIGQAGCSYTISLEGTTPVARSPSGAEIVDSAGTDAGAFINSLLASHGTYCIAAGDYNLTTDIHVDELRGVTLSLAPGAVMKSSTGSGLLLVDASPGTVVKGGEWVGPDRGRVSAIRVAWGSNDTVIERVDVSASGRDGILVYDNVHPCFNVSVLDNVLHGNRRFGVQVFSNSTADVGTVVSGNVAVNNYVGGIYTNGVAGVAILDNVVSNSVRGGPGEIGIGVTNGYNETVGMNQVENMTWYGIQAYYNNDTVIEYNVSTQNAGGGDQSGITNDHSSYDTILGNLVQSNGDYGIYLERSWNVTVSGNVADDNLGYGIGLYHGTVPEMGRVTISGNTCSFNGLGGIILNSAVDDVISTNVCYDNSGDGILLYNDPGQVGSTGNLVSENWLGNLANSNRTQAFGIREANGSDGNTLVSNFFENEASAVSLVGNDSESP